MNVKVRCCLSFEFILNVNAHTVCKLNVILESSLRANECHIGFNESIIKVIDHTETNLDTSEWIFSVNG